MKQIILILFIVFSLQGFSQNNTKKSNTSKEQTLNFLVTYRHNTRIGATKKANENTKKLNKKGWYIIKINESTSKVAPRQGARPITLFFTTIVYEKKAIKQNNK